VRINVGQSCGGSCLEVRQRLLLPPLSLQAPERALAVSGHVTSQRKAEASRRPRRPTGGSTLNYPFALLNNNRSSRGDIAELVHLAAGPAQDDFIDGRTGSQAEVDAHVVL
jgi:hypothetical protein